MPRLKQSLVTFYTDAFRSSVEPSPAGAAPAQVPSEELYRLKLPRRLERNLLKHFSQVELLGSIKESTPWSLNVTPKVKHGKRDAIAETVSFSGESVQKIVRSLLAQPTSWSTVQQRGFKTVRSISAELKRNPALYTRMKDALGKGAHTLVK